MGMNVCWQTGWVRVSLQALRKHSSCSFHHSFSAPGFFLTSWGCKSPALLETSLRKIPWSVWPVNIHRLPSPPWYPHEMGKKVRIPATTELHSALWYPSPSANGAVLVARNSAVNEVQKPCWLLATLTSRCPSWDGEGHIGRWTKIPWSIKKMVLSG